MYVGFVFVFIGVLLDYDELLVHVESCLHFVPCYC